MKYTLVNPKIEDSKMELSFDANTAIDAANKAWVELANKLKIKELKKRFFFTLKNSDGKLNHFKVEEQRGKEKHAEGKPIDFNIKEVQGKKSAPEKLSRMYGGGKKDDSDSSDSSESESSGSSSESGVYISPRLKTVELYEAPVVTWVYNPTVYDVEYVYIPRSKLIPQFVITV